MNMNRMSALVYLLSAASIMSVLLAQAPAVNTLSSTFCGFVKGVQSIVGLVAIALFLVGGVLYAMAHFLPSSLEYRKSLIGWATAMIVGGVIGLVVVILASPIIGLFTNIAGQVGGGLAPSITC